MIHDETENPRFEGSQKTKSSGFYMWPSRCRSRHILLFVCVFILCCILYLFKSDNVGYVYSVDSYKLPCEMPNLDPFDPVQMSAVQKLKAYSCDGSLNVVFVDDDNILKFNEPVLRLKQLDKNKIQCMCHIIQRTPNSDTSLVYSDRFGCDPPHDVQADFFKVTCLYGDTEIVNTQLTKVLRSQKTFKQNTDDYYNVVLFGIDSMSTNDALRQIPETVKYLQDALKATVFSMYNRVGGHTFDNVVPMLTGLLANTDDIPYLHQVGERFEKIPFIWRNFSLNHYATFYAEDLLQFHTFNFQKEGFSAQPTDHYIRPFWIADYESRPSKLLFWKESFSNYNKQKCLGNTPKYLVQMNYLRQFIHTYRKERKFAMSHINDLSHQDVNNLHQAENHFIELFKWMKNGGHLKNTFLIVYSDHGPRGQSQTHQSLLETNKPFLGFVAPTDFLKKYPKLVANVQRNANVLTTNFDLFATLRDILNRQFLDPSEFYVHGKRRGISLFRDIRVQRSCEEASIPEQFCMCYGSRILNTTNNPLVTDIAQSVVAKLNKMTSAEDGCAHLSLSAILEARVLVQGRRTVPINRGAFNNFNTHSDVDDYSDYKIIIETIPGKGMFYATSKIDANGRRYVLDDVERINRYDNQSHCVSKDSLRPVCYCKTQ